MLCRDTLLCLYLRGYSLDCLLIITFEYHIVLLVCDLLLVITGKYHNVVLLVCALCSIVQ